jgi:hypothetical protein
MLRNNLCATSALPAPPPSTSLFSLPYLKVVLTITTTTITSIHYFATLGNHGDRLDMADCDICGRLHGWGFYDQNAQSPPAFLQAQKARSSMNHLGSHVTKKAAVRAHLNCHFLENPYVGRCQKFYNNLN